MNQNTNKKLIFITVGTGVSGSDIAEGIFHSIKTHRPDDIVLIYSDGSKDTIAHIQKLIDESKTTPNISLELVNEVNDIEILYGEYSKIIYKYSKTGFRKENIIVDFTSGTKAMSTALVNAAISLDIGELSYVYGQRGSGGRVIHGTERVSAIFPVSIYAEKQIILAIELFNRYQFNSAQKILDELNNKNLGLLKNQIEFLTTLNTAFYEWDKFNFKSAFTSFDLIDSNSELKEFANSQSISVSKLKELLYYLQNINLSIQHAVDLVANASRRAAEGKYDDAIARLYRALEMIGQIEFIKLFNCTTSDVIVEKLPKELHPKLEQYYDPKDGKYKIPLFSTYDILNHSGNATAKLFFDHIVDIKRVLSFRNKSILAHGSVPATESYYTEFAELINKIYPSIAEMLKLHSFKSLRYIR